MVYIDRYSNHPPSIIKQLPTSINRRFALQQTAPLPNALYDIIISTTNYIGYT
jgi:hypothetical protein